MDGGIILITFSSYNTIKQCTFADNSRALWFSGIEILGPSSHNHITYNNFINNYHGTTDRDVEIDFGSKNTLDYNFWSEYTGEDEDGDGIGDEPFKIDIFNIDRHPFIKPVGIESEWPEQPDKPSGETNGKTDEWYEYSTTTHDPDGNRIRYYFDWGDGDGTWTDYYESGKRASVLHKWEEKGIYYIRVMAQDEYGLKSEWSEPLPVTMPKKRNLFSKYCFFGFLSKLCFSEIFKMIC